MMKKGVAFVPQDEVTYIFMVRERRINKIKRAYEDGDVQNIAIRPHFGERGDRQFSRDSYSFPLFLHDVRYIKRARWEYGGRETKRGEWSTKDSSKNG
jgi:hypothetical protein